jgi:hypothetical protein
MGTLRVSHWICNKHFPGFTYNCTVSKLATWSVSNSKRILLDVGQKQNGACQLCVWCTSLWPSCFPDKLETLGLQPMLTVLQKLGLSTSSVPPSGQPYDWLQTVGQAQRMLGLNIMVGFWVSQDVRNTSRNLMVVSSWPPVRTQVYLSTYSSVHTYLLIPWLCGAHGSVVGWGTMLEAGTLRVQFPMRSLDFSIDLIFPAALWPWGRLSR